MMNEKNVLLLSMSTLPNNMKVQQYYFEENEEKIECYGYSQLEPITKLIIQKLEKQGKKLDKIVIMASKEALETKNRVVDCAAVPFYMQRINEYLSERNVQKSKDDSCFQSLIEKNEIVNEYLSDYSFPEDVEMPSVKDVSIEIVKIYGKEELNVFFDVIDCIKATGNHVNLYLDMQGGDRNTVAQMNAIVNLLEDQGVRIKARYAISFNYAKNIHKINEVSEKYTAYQLIGAMQSFKKYGRGQSLLDYFEGKKTNRDHEVLLAIQKASDAIRLCDMDEFDDAVSKIEQIKNKREKEKGSNEKTELDIVFDDIQKDYEKLFGQGKGMYIAKIKWCLEKGFLQQALTIVESKIPEYLYDLGIITVDMEKEITGSCKMGDEIVYERPMKVSEIIQALKKELRKNYAKDQHILIEQLCLDNISGKNYQFPDSVKTVNELLKAYHQDYKKRSCFTIGKKTKYKYLVTYKVKDEYLEKNKNAYMAHFLKLHWVLKQQRNNINHSSNNDSRFSKEKLERYIRFYVELGELLELDPVQNRKE